MRYRKWFGLLANPYARGVDLGQSLHRTGHEMACGSDAETTHCRDDQLRSNDIGSDRRERQRHGENGSAKAKRYRPTFSADPDGGFSTWDRAADRTARPRAGRDLAG